MWLPAGGIDQVAGALQARVDLVAGVAPVRSREPTMNKARKVVFHSVSQEERQRQRHYQKDVPIIIVLIILFGTLSVLMDLWQAPVPILISAL